MKKQIGYSLIELMVAGFLGIFVVGGMLTIFIATIQSSSNTIKSARLNHDLESVSQLMTNELRRAGFWGGTKVGEDTLNNPSMLDFANIYTGDYSGDGEINCIIYTYDADDNTVIDTNEYFGFRHNGDGIDMRFSVASTASASDVSCSNSDVGTRWENIIDTGKLKITELTFSLENSKCFNTTDTTMDPDRRCSVAISDGDVLTGDRLIETRQVLITLKGEVSSDDTVEKKYMDDNRIRVKVRNNRIFVYEP